MYVRSCALSDPVAARIWCQHSTGTFARAAIEAASVFGASVRVGALAPCSAALPPPQPATASSATTSPVARLGPGRRVGQELAGPQRRCESIGRAGLRAPGYEPYDVAATIAPDPRCSRWRHAHHPPPRPPPVAAPAP